MNSMKVWVFVKDGFYSIATSSEEAVQMADALEILPRDGILVIE